MCNEIQENINSIERPTELRVDTNKIISALKNRGCLEKDIQFIMQLIDGQEVYDVSGYSGCSTIITKSYDTGIKEYCIKICDILGNLEKEAYIWSIMAKWGMTSNFVKYVSTNKDYLVTIRISEPMALYKYQDASELTKYMGMTLRRFHNMPWKDQYLTKDEISFFERKGIHQYETAINNKQGLRFIADDLGSNDYDAMKKYLKEFKSLCKFDEVLIHGDYNPRNVFAISPDKTWFVDMTDMCFGDRHYDIFFAIWTLQFYFGINKDIQKAKKCEEMFIDAYGRDVFDDNRYNYCKYLVCMYWNEHNDLVHIV